MIGAQGLTHAWRKQTASHSGNGGRVQRNARQVDVAA
jgi:hypothetical protein